MIKNQVYFMEGLWKKLSWRFFCYDIDMPYIFNMHIFPCFFQKGKKDSCDCAQSKAVKQQNACKMLSIFNFFPYLRSEGHPWDLFNPNCLFTVIAQAATLHSNTIVCRTPFKEYGAAGSKCDFDRKPSGWQTSQLSTIVLFLLQPFFLTLVFAL